MTLSVRGKNSKISKTEIRYATEFFLSLLFKKKPKVLDELEIDIQFINLARNKGFCNLEDDVDKDPRLFLIELDPRLSRKQQLLTLAHELVHVKQYALNEMFDYDHKTVYFQRKVINTDEVDYWDQPYEIEAWGRQEGLYMRYMEHLKDARIKFRKPQKKIPLVQRGNLQ